MVDKALAPAWRNDPATRKVMTALDAEAGKALFVGGCVRNTLFGIPITDVDIATLHPPKETMRLIEAAGMTAKATGLTHGTITAIANQKLFEITTLRRDVETDGRRAVVAYTQDWAEDAARRDFTINALFMDLDGRILDTVGGERDAREGRIRFIGEPAERIRQDVLRILRFFRFQAQYGRKPIDAEGFRACSTNSGLLKTLSGSRIQKEILKLLAAPGAGLVVDSMAESRILAPLFGTPLQIDALRRLIALEGKTPDPLRRLSILTIDLPQMIAQRLQMSNAQRKRLTQMAVDRIDLNADMRALRERLYRLGADRFTDAVFVSAALNGTKYKKTSPMLQLAREWTIPRLPVKGSDLLHLGLSPGEPLGLILDQIETRWIAADFQETRETCLAWAAELIQKERGK
ncbi:MAG: CCA tRNA nucleotidyltransferase [Rhodospirillaceae bacterium]|nr:CCA tRNA nucleotidyltransferase [Rhodospirillaceae bacterium]